MNDKPTDATGAPDPAFDQLRAADPARDVTPDLGLLEAAIRSRIASQPDVLSSTDELTSRRERRTPAWLAWTAAAAAAVVVLGGTGFALGRGVDNKGEGSAQGPSVARPEPGPARDEDVQKAAGSGGDHGGGYGGGGFSGRTVFSSSGLSDTAGSAEAWGFDAQQVFSKETAQRLAKAFGLTAEPRQAHGAWVIGPDDGSGPTLNLQPDPLTSFSFHDPTRDPHRCPEGKDPKAEAEDIPHEVPECTPPPGAPAAPSVKEAIAMTKDLVRGLGLDADAFEYDMIEQSKEWAHVSVFWVVGGDRPGDLSWHAAWSGAGLSSFNGHAAPVVSLGRYDVVSEREAVARLSDPRFGITSVVDTRMDHHGGDVALDSDRGGATTPSATAPAPLKPGAKLSWPVEKVTLTKARLTVAMHMHPQPSGPAAMLPTYELSDGDGRTWSVLAVADRHLDFGPAR